MTVEAVEDSECVYRPGGISAGMQQREIASLVLCNIDGGVHFKLLTTDDVSSTDQLVQLSNTTTTVLIMPLDACVQYPVMNLSHQHCKPMKNCIHAFSVIQ